MKRGQRYDLPVRWEQVLEIHGQPLLLLGTRVSRRVCGQDRTSLVGDGICSGLVVGVRGVQEGKTVIVSSGENNDVDVGNLGGILKSYGGSGETFRSGLIDCTRNPPRWWVFIVTGGRMVDLTNIDVTYLEL